MASSLVDAPRVGDEASIPVVRWRDDHVGLAAGAALALAAFLVGWWRYANLHAQIDLALFDQAMWKLAHGRAPELTVLPENLFGDHFSPAILVVAPLYRIVATPLWLVAAQALAVGLAVPALRGLARQVGGSEALATVATVLSAPLLSAAVFDVHPIVATVPVTAAALAAGLRGDRRAVTILGVLVILLRADAAVVLLGVAVLASPRCRPRLVALAAAGAAIGVAVPLLLHSEQTFTRYWGHLGESPVDAALHPWRLGPALVSSSVVATLVIWLLPVGFLTLAKPRWALATAVAGLPILLSSAPATSMAVFHHAATYVPFVVGGALVVVAERRWVWSRPATLVVGLVLALAVASPLAPGTPRSAALAEIVRPVPIEGAQEALAAVGPDDDVAAPAWLLPRLAHRDGAYVTGDLLGAADPAAALEGVDVVLVAEPAEAEQLRDLGWDVEAVGPSLAVARPRTPGS